MGRTFSFDGDVAADVTDAEAAIIRLNAEAQSLVSTESVARLLLRAEAVASSRIEGLRVGARRLLQAERLGVSLGGQSDVTAEEVLGNIDAMAAALDATTALTEVTVETILGIHTRLLAGTELLGARWSATVPSRTG